MTRFERKLFGCTIIAAILFLVTAWNLFTRI